MADIIESTLKTAGPNGVVLFSKTYCRYSTMVKEELASIGVSPVVIELDQHPDGREIQASLLEKTGQSTVPSVWLDGQFIGDSQDTHRNVQRGAFRENTKMSNIRRHAEMAGLRHWFLIG